MSCWVRRVKPVIAPIGQHLSGAPFPFLLMMSNGRLGHAARSCTCLVACAVITMRAALAEQAALTAAASRSLAAAEARLEEQDAL